MVSRSCKRIPRFLVRCSTIWFASAMLLALQGLLFFDLGGDPAHDRIPNAFFVDALSLPTLSNRSLGRTIAPATITRRQHYASENSIQRPKTTAAAPTTTTRLSAAIPFYATEPETKTTAKESSSETNPSSPAFLIESIDTVPTSGNDIYKEIANLCIGVFFGELIDPSGKGNVNLLKAWQIRYLKNLQSADLERRRRRQPDTNEMFLAYEVRKARGAQDALSQPLLMDDQLEAAYNLPDNNEDDDACYVRGDMLGFVEVTQRSYGIGTGAGGAPALMDMASMAGSSNNMRPVLTNLAVLKDRRGSGIGSRLLEACEDHVVGDWKMNEIVLEVEDYNDSGLEFYKRKGYTVLFSDPASRRFDIEGFWLSKVRCRRDIMRKSLQAKPPDFLKILRKIRKTVSL